MTVLNRIAYYRERRDEVPNQELARELAKRKDRDGLREIAENLWSKHRDVQSDCLKVLYEVGYLNPELITDYTADFLKLLRSKNNRLVWGSLIALSTIAELKAEAIAEHFDEIVAVMDNGSVITRDNGVKTLAVVASKNEQHRPEIFRYLLKHLATCRPKDVPQHAEKTLVAVTAKHKREFVGVLEKRLGDMTAAQAVRIRKVMKEAEQR